MHFFFFVVHFFLHVLNMKALNVEGTLVSMETWPNWEADCRKRLLIPLRNFPLALPPGYITGHDSALSSASHDTLTPRPTGRSAEHLQLSIAHLFLCWVFLSVREQHVLERQLAAAAAAAAAAPAPISDPSGTIFSNLMQYSTDIFVIFPLNPW